MNKTLTICASALMTLAFAFVSCEKETIVETIEVPASPYLLLSTTMFAAPLSGGAYNFTCSVVNSTDDGQLSCTGNVSWVSGIEISGGTVYFTVEENATEDPRSGVITVSYSSSNGNTSEYVTVVQHAGTIPSLEVELQAMTVEPEGGSYSFGYTLTDPDPEGSLSCSVDVGWISELTLGTDGVVSFTVEEWTDEELRSGCITLTYVYTYATLVREVSIVQDYHGGTNGIPDYTDLIGTYEASGVTVKYDSATDTDEYVDVTWKLIIADNGNLGVYIWGLTPLISTRVDYEDEDDETGSPWLTNYHFYASASFDDLHRLVVPSQFLPFTTINHSPAAYIPCTEYDENWGAFYGTEDELNPDLTFVYDNVQDVWVSDYGVGLASYYSRTWSTFSGWYDFVIPSVTLKKVSSDIIIND